MRNSALLLSIILSLNAIITCAQDLAHERTYPKTWLKVNAPALLVGIPQVGLEHHFHPAISYQIDALGSFWKSIKGAPFQIGMFSNELRYYPNHKASGFFVAANLAAAKYRLQKWNYWGTDYVQVGQSIFMGLNFGYAWHWNDRLKSEVFAAFGNQQAWYKGLNRFTGEREDPITLGGWNKSGEWIPYRAGITLSIPLKGPLRRWVGFRF